MSLSNLEAHAARTLLRFAAGQGVPDSEATDAARTLSAAARMTVPALALPEHVRLSASGTLHELLLKLRTHARLIDDERESALYGQAVTRSLDLLDLVQRSGFSLQSAPADSEAEGG